MAQSSLWNVVAKDAAERFSHNSLAQRKGIGAALRPGERRIGMVFQNYVLYPHFSSRRNVLSYFFFRKKTPELDAMAQAKFQRTSDLMGVELEYLLDRSPTTLSGGEKQRVALARCITRDATLFLVDEPFANLDQALREKYRVNLKSLLRQFNITTVYVTHVECSPKFYSPGGA
jgi:ABC-type sugar transport system ATPase subunit